MAMPNGVPTAVLDGLRRIYDGGGTVAGLGADSLLARFAARGDEAAFAAIVARHGPMVLGVCRRILGRTDDVEDAFQATFLVFVRKARSIRDGEALGPWLHGVARRVATRARAVAARRRATERIGLDADPAGPAEDPDRDEVRAVVDEEIGRLPERYRRPVVLCDLEGLTQGEAARSLDWTEGAVRGRLARARGLLRTRLARRGFAAPAGAIAGLFAADAASAARPGLALARGSMVGIGMGATADVEGVSTTAVALAREVLRAMMTHKLRSMAVGTMIAGVALAGAGSAIVRGLRADDGPRQARPAGRRAHPNPSGDERRSEAAPVPELWPIPGLAEPMPADQLKNPPEPEPANARRIAIGDRLLIEALETLPGRPITGERVVKPDGTVSLGFYGELAMAGLTRREAKIKVIELLRPYITDQSLGLVAWGGDVAKWVVVHPARSDRVFVDDSPTFDTQPRAGNPPRSELPKSARSSAGPPDRPSPRPSAEPAGAKPMTFQPGNHVLIEALQALPGRPITGERVVRPDGTVSLGFYGDLAVAGLTRAEVKVRAIEHLRQWLDDATLGLVETKGGKVVPVPPERSTHVFVDSLEDIDAAPRHDRLGDLDRKLDRILQELEDLKRERKR